MGSYVESLARKLGFKEPNLSAEQLNMTSAKLARFSLTPSLPPLTPRLSRLAPGSLAAFLTGMHTQDLDSETVVCDPFVPSPNSGFELAT